MCGFVSGNQLVNQCVRCTHVEIFALFSIQKSVGRKKDEPRPSLAFFSRQLSQSQLTVGEWTKSLGIVTNGPRRSFRHSRCVAGGRGRRWSNQYHLRQRRLRIDLHRGHGRLGEVPFHAGSRISFNADVSCLRRASYVLAKIESSHGHGTLRNPVRDLLVDCNRSRSLHGFCRWLGERHRLAGCQQSPTRWVVEGEIVIGHGHSSIGVPCAARTHVEQAFARLRYHLSTVHEAELDTLSFPRRFGQNHSQHIVAATRQPRALYRGIVDEFDRFPVRLDPLDLQKPGQFERQETPSAAHHVELQFHVGIQLFRRFHMRINRVAAHENAILKRLRFGRERGRSFSSTRLMPRGLLRRK